MPPTQDHDEPIESRLRAAGLRVTQPRLLVYGLLRELAGHLSVGELLKALTDRGERVTRMTIYNVLNDLQHAGLVMMADAVLKVG